MGVQSTCGRSATKKLFWHIICKFLGKRSSSEIVLNSCDSNRDKTEMEAGDSIDNALFTTSADD